MKLRVLIQLIIVFLHLTFFATAQQKKRQKRESKAIFREFVQLGRWYLDVPLQMNVHFIHKSIPVTTKQDNAETDLVLYYGRNDFYMQAEGMEQIANDTLVVLVNSEAKMIQLFTNNGQLMQSLKKMVSAFQPDSSLETFIERYSSKMEDQKNGAKRITLQSKDKISGTDLHKETVSITYHAGTYQPLAYDRSKLTLLPVDSRVYMQLQKDTTYNGRLVKSRTVSGDLFFIVKEQITQCRFTNIDYDRQTPPAREQDRVVKAPNGEYQPAKGFEDYIVSKEW